MKIDISLCWVLVLCLLPVMALAQIPERPDPPRLVNDLAGVLGDTDELEDTLVAHARRTSNQIVVITINDLGGYEPWEFAQQVGQQWGVGGKKFNNGVVVLIKPKVGDDRGRAFIATGYGLEGALTDATCTQIVNREMIPSFKENDYAGGVWKAVNVLMPITAGEYSEEQYVEEEEDDDLVIDLIVTICFIIFLIIWFKNHSDGFGVGGSGHSGNTGTWGGPIIFGSGGSSSSSSSWGGGGFGGFGGGSFGGGGGGGSW